VFMMSPSMGAWPAETGGDSFFVGDGADVPGGILTVSSLV